MWNKIVFFSVPFFIFLFLNISAQTFSGGVVSGIVASQISGDGLGGFNKFSGQLGGFITKKISDTLQVDFQMYYLQKGSRKAANGITGSLFSYKLRLNYIEMPVLFRYNYKNKFNFEGGASAAVLFKSKVSNAFGELPLNDPENRPFRPLEFAWIIGASYPVNKNILIYIRNSNSLIPVRKHQSNSVFRLNWGQYNSVMLFGLQFKV
ncbi:MAG: porin family protein [Bacteroidota bacterium]